MALKPRIKRRISDAYLLRYLFPDVSTQAHLEHTVRLAASGRVRLKPTITHILDGIASVPNASKR